MLVTGNHHIAEPRRRGWDGRFVDEQAHKKTCLCGMETEKLAHGRPCKHGHCGLRWKSNGNCYQCTRRNVLRYHERHRTRRLTYFDTYRRGHLAEFAKRSKEWSQANRVYAKNQGAWRRGAAGQVTAVEWEVVLATHGHRCVRCGVGGPLEMDHIVGISEGGLNVSTNIQPLCKPCNGKKYWDSSAGRLRRGVA